MRHKCFISFKKEDEGYKKEIQRWNEGNKRLIKESKILLMK